MFSLFKLDDDDVSKTRSAINFYCTVLIVYASIGGPINVDQLVLFGSTETLDEWKVFLFFTVILAYLNFKLFKFGKVQPKIQSQRLLRDDEKLRVAAEKLNTVLQDTRTEISQLANAIAKVNLTESSKKIDPHIVRTEETRNIINEYANILIAENRAYQNRQVSKPQKTFNDLQFAAKAESLLGNLERLCNSVANIKDTRGELVSEIESQLVAIKQDLNRCHDGASFAYFDQLAKAFDQTELDMTPLRETVSKDAKLFDYFVPRALSFVAIILAWHPQIMKSLSDLMTKVIYLLS
jgi:hypothetical protein